MLPASTPHLPGSQAPTLADPALRGGAEPPAVTDPPAHLPRGPPPSELARSELPQVKTLSQCPMPTDGES